MSQYRAKSYSAYKDQSSIKFEAVLRGKLEFLRQVKGSDDPVYLRLLEKYQEISILSSQPEFVSETETQVFISYSRQDEKFVRRLAALLLEQGANVWIDIRNIPAGINWSTAIQDGLRSCTIMLLIVTPDSMASSNVQDEWQYFHTHSKPIIPALLKPAGMHFQIDRLQRMDFHRQEFTRAFAQLCQELQRHGLNLNQD